MRLSRRLPEDLAPSALSRRLASLSPRPIDLTATNPTVAELHDSADALALWATPEGRVYAPDPAGLPAARAALAAHLRPETPRGQAPRTAEDLVLTASTSEAYALLFKLVADPGDAVVCPTPSYPLIEHLARAEGLRPVAVASTYAGGWRVDLDALEACLRQGARVVVSVSPNNPTGAVLRDDEARAIAQCCAAYDALWIIDQVFATYGFAGELARFPREAPGAVAVLDGLSKRAGLPQVKLGWIALYGPEEERARLRAGLGWLTDLTLSVSTPVQHALGALLAREAEVQGRIRGRVRAHRAALAQALRARPEVELLAADGGWCVMLRVPHVVDEETWVWRLASEHGVLVQPGWFYESHTGAHLVVSLLPPPAVFGEGLARLCAGLGAIGG